MQSAVVAARYGSGAPFEVTHEPAEDLPELAMGPSSSTATGPSRSTGPVYAGDQIVHEDGAGMGESARPDSVLTGSWARVDAATSS